LFGAALALRTDVIMQPLALALALVTCSAFLVTIGRPKEDHLPRLAAVLLTLLSASFATLWATNLPTMLISWTIYDLLRAAGHVAAGGSRQRAVRDLVFGGVATMLLWGGALLSESGTGSELWTLSTLASTPLVLWMLAGVLRLWIYPLHLPASSDFDTTPLAAPLLLGPIVGWGLWFRLALANGGSIPGGAWAPSIAAITLALGGFLAWSCQSPRRSLPWIGMGTTGAILLAASLEGENALVIIAAGGVVWALGVTVLFLTPFLNAGQQRKALWWSIPSLIGALALAGAPLTLGFVAEATLVGELSKGSHPEWGVAFFVGYLFLIPSLVRWLLSSSLFPPPSRRWHLLVCGAGLGLPALLLIVAGLHPPFLIHAVFSPHSGVDSYGTVPSLGMLFARPGLMGWLLWALPLAGGGVLAWQEKNLRSTIGLWLSAAHDLLRLEWLYEILVGALERGLSLFRVADEIVGGAGALLWSWLLFLLLLLIWSGK
jgi:formate hydrogenlyase subunit 3/multisubunit Na+/H+ antiporter MnhD subunit